MGDTIIKEKLDKIRALMSKNGADFYLVPSSDPHKNEYVPECWQRRQWISDFSGSAGDVLIGQEQAYLWTDSRYFLQAHNQLDANYFELKKQLPSEPTIDQWIAQQAQGTTLAVDPQLISIKQTEKLLNALELIDGELLPIDSNLIDEIWLDQPNLPSSPIRLQTLNYAGESSSNKISKLRQALKKEHADALVISALDNIAWLFNIRGNDIDYNPLVISYAIIDNEGATLFVDPKKITPEAKDYFTKEKISTKPYTQLKEALTNLRDTVWVDPASSSWWVEMQLDDDVDLLLKPSPLLLMKAVKNKVEQASMRKAHEIDAIAVIRFLHWLENHWQAGVSEISAAEKLESFRREDPRLLDLSFDTISGFGPHGAIIHYSVTPESNITIDDSSLYLVDSGGQYHLGTTDITRTIHLGTPTAEQKHHYTLVLKGHLALRHIKFPDRTCGEHINTVAQAPLWNEGLNYGHGTGHGVGCYLCVHEGPQRISVVNSNTPLKPGMMVSNEPGLYFENQYGIRIENVCVVQEIMNKGKTGHGPFYQLDDLTLVPYCKKLINVDELSAKEIEQINEYHQRIFTTLAGQLESDTKALAWLKEATDEIGFTLRR